MKINIANIKVGDKVCYQPKHYIGANEDGSDKWENGVVKEVPDYTVDSIRVVYNCAGEWENYMDYTSALTNIRDLILGWKH